MANPTRREVARFALPIDSRALIDALASLIPDGESSVRAYNGSLILEAPPLATLGMFDTDPDDAIVG